ncbi:hypothetical protein PENFLA_c005G05545 [Penicillium flavigenum]|uniref:Copper transport protein n=1 Tax=Penicillium flavigenum TaxID=254877 RepID=A0A1V6TP83_9EURO|nr:hypothetical protein PENFLA_c005G05545 [Penicillium flavigenum]
MDMDMNMPAVFSASTEITILFTGWTTSTTTEYVFTLTFLFILAIFNRFLGALKFQLERSWSQHSSSPPTLLLAPVNARRNIRKAKLSPLPDYMRIHGDEDEEETLPVSNNNETRSTTMRSLKRDGPRKRMSLTCMLPSWKASGTWSLRKDGTRALLECVRALIGYFLMLSVMTFNVGVFVVVLFGVLVGELLLGRFSQGTPGWQEGTCHVAAWWASYVLIEKLSKSHQHKWDLRETACLWLVRVVRTFDVASFFTKMAVDGVL